MYRKRRFVEIVSQNKEKQIEYTSRLKTLMDYNTIMEERYEKGRQELLKELMEMGIALPEEILSSVDILFGEGVIPKKGNSVTLSRVRHYVECKKNK